MKIPSLFLLVALCLVTANASAQVSYVQQFALPPQRTIVIPTVRAPVDTSAPGYNPALPDPFVIVDDGEYFIMNTTDGSYSEPVQFPAALKLDSSSKVTLSRLNGTDPLLYLTGSRGAIYTFDFATQLVVVDPPPRINVQVIYSIAANGKGNFAMIADNNGSSVNPVTGALTPIFTKNGGTALGDFSLSTQFLDYGQNGLLYVLDYGNNRMQMLDPANNFAPVGQFTLNSGVTTANVQFAIGVNGDVYLADGAGGGSAYTASGTFLDTFDPVDPVEADGGKGVDYLTTDSAGHVYWVEGEGGDFFQYLDTYAAPEPSTWALLLLGGAGLALARRRAERS